MNIVCIGAHPDDAEVFAGGTCVKWVRHGHRVLMASMTNGDIGHHRMAGGVLVRRRIAEARAAAQRAGAASLVLEYHDGEFEATLEARKRIVKMIREFAADLVLTHRPNDYHPDHRYTSVAVQDSAFMVTVPNFCPETPPLSRNPVFLYFMDEFTRPNPFRPDIAVDVSDVMDVKWSMLDAMESQMYEWLPWLEGRLESVPADATERRHWLEQTWDNFLRKPAQAARPALEKSYGKKAAAGIRYAELFEICEFGHRPTPEELARLFPFARKKTRKRGGKT